ncbi:MAG: hypothetical protein JST30_10640 [Armatimonadetes bacterium]|nr:hypothetical protein [Armatimonadota bacterium]
MKDKDRLIDAAFDGAVQDLPALGPSENRELDLLKGLKRDLAALKEVPECQLTADRVKNAILASRAVPARSPARWFWIPTAAAAALAVIAVTRMNGLPDAVPQAGPPRATSPDAGTVASRGSDRSSAPTGEAVAMTSPEPVMADLRSEGFSPKLEDVSSTRRIRIRSSAPKPAGAGEERTVVDAVNRVAMAATGTTLRSTEPTRPEATPVSADKPEPEPVVVVSPDLNPETGVSDAKEVSRPKDVLFGG